MKKISKKSLSLVFAALFMLSGNFGLLSNKALADKTLGGSVPSEKTVLGEGEFIGGDGRVYKLVGYVGRGNQTHVFKCLCKDDNKFYVTKLCKDDVGTWLGFEKSFSKVLYLLRASSKNKVYKSEDDTEAPVLVPPPAPNKLRNPSRTDTARAKPRDGGTPIASSKRGPIVGSEKTSLDFGDKESTSDSKTERHPGVLTWDELDEFSSAPGVDGSTPDLLDELFGPGFSREDSTQSQNVKVRLDFGDEKDFPSNEGKKSLPELSLVGPCVEDEEKSDHEEDFSQKKGKKPLPDSRFFDCSEEDERRPGEKPEHLKPPNMTSVSLAIDEYVRSAIKTQPGGSSPPGLVEVLSSGCPLVEVFYPTTLDKASIPTSVCGRVIKNWLTNLITGLVYLHDRQICHRDVKPSNIFVENGRVYLAEVGADLPLCFCGVADPVRFPQRFGSLVLDDSDCACPAPFPGVNPIALSITGGSLRLGDFGSARHFNDCTECRGTPAYMAPEVWARSTTNPAFADRSDVFGVGITALEMLIPGFDATKSFLASGVDSLHYEGALAERNKMLLDTIREKYGDIMSGELMHLLERCLDPDPIHRATAREVREILSSISAETFKRDFENLRRCVC